MKRIFGQGGFLVFVVLLLAFMGFTLATAGTLHWGAGKTPTKFDQHSAIKSASGVHVSSRCVFTGFVVTTDGTNAVTLSFYNNASAGTGTLLPPGTITIPGNAYVYPFGFSPGIYASAGIYVTMSVAGGGTASISVLYDQG